MKKVLVFLFAIASLYVCLGCGSNQDDPEVPANFYYRNASTLYNDTSAVIVCEVRDCAGCGNSVQQILDLYLQGPISDECISVFPEQVFVESAELVNGSLQITLSPAFASLEGIHLSIACACLAKTAIDLTQCDKVEISVSNADLHDFESITVNVNSLLLMDALEPDLES